MAFTRNTELFYFVYIGNPNVASALPDLKQVAIYIIIIYYTYFICCDTVGVIYCNKQ